MIRKTQKGFFKVRIEEETNRFILPAYAEKLDTGVVVADTSHPIIKKGDRIVYDSSYIHDLEDGEAFIEENVIHAKITEDGLVPLLDILYIDTDKTKNEGFKHGSLDLRYPTQYKKFQTDQVTQDGVIKFIGNHPTLKEGDRVYTHHFLCDDSNEKRIESLGKTYFSLSYRDVYCVIRDGEIEMTDEWNFVTPIDEDESNYKTDSGIFIKSEVEKRQLYGTIRHVGKDLRDQGVKQGDTVMFLPDREYEMNVEGNTYYRIKAKDFIAVE